MQPRSKSHLFFACLLGTAAACGPLVPRALASDFTAFADDENVCRQVGASAIHGAAGPAAAKRYDFAYRGCMARHLDVRRRQYFANGNDEPVGNPHSFEYPDAFYSIPYATPGYGYDGFSY